ncbi:MFS transporter [Loktanella sp. S4079]|uniref:MFS transporter n=1 Tax=Loktanella sp. S4079 TaxID=579483 RepID=UPI0005FA2D34|nr:MFS transporter [Loktanella sp. S4079]KJZ19424.1 MFS transporter [Loktanella sp. S4079]
MHSFASYLRFIKDNAPFLAVGALLSALSSFGQTFLIAVFAGEIRAEYGLSNGQWGTIYMVATMTSAAVMVYAGGLTDRFRVRSLGVLVLVLLALSCVGMALNTHVLGLVLIVFCLRLFGQGMSSTISVVAISRWFIATRGRALAVSTLGFIIAEATLPLTSVWLKSHADWRTIWLGFAGFIIVMIPLLWILLKRERTPQSAAKEDTATGMDDRHWTRAEALKHPLFWTLAPAMALFPMLATAFWFHQVHFAELKGWEHLKFVAVFPLGTFTFMGATFLFGWAVDKYGVGRLLPIYLLPYSVAFIIHAFSPTIGWSALGVILMGLVGGGQATLPGSVWSTYFGTAYIGSIKSASVALMVLGSAIGPGLSGWLIDIGVGFDTQLLFYSATFIIASLAMVPAVRKAEARLPAAS